MPTPEDHVAMEQQYSQIESYSEYIERLNRFGSHKRQVGISWSDDGALLECHREECNERYVRNGKERFVWWQRELPYLCTPELAVELRDKHLRGGW